MDDFSVGGNIPNMAGMIQGKPNILAPGKRPLSSMAPTILTKDNQLYLVLGSHGGPSIITQVLQVILNVMDYKMNIQQAVDMPRYHMQWLPDIVFMEPFTFSKDTFKLLTQMGYHFKLGYFRKGKPWGGVEAILKDPNTGFYFGANDSRAESGLALGD